tara:strand:- start:92 stop:256 length:165 start_codon:yes stop_codon:yes gene_type:complete
MVVLIFSFASRIISSKYKDRLGKIFTGNFRFHVLKRKEYQLQIMEKIAWIAITG